MSYLTNVRQLSMVTGHFGIYRPDRHRETDVRWKTDCCAWTTEMRLLCAIAEGRHSEEIRWERLKMRDLMLKYNGILVLIL